MAKASFESVDAYLAAQPERARAFLETVRGVLRRALPGADEVISYQIPTYELGGRAVLYVAGWKDHVSVYPASPGLRANFAKELAAHTVEKATIRFALDRPVPRRLIARIAKFRVAEVAAKKR